MNNGLIASQEEAAAVAAEFISSLDNLPNEVQHLLAEIRHKESRVQELQQEIQRDQTRYIRHAIKGSAPKDPKENGKDKEKDTKEKDALIPARVSTNYAEMDTLAAEKIGLSARLVELLARVNARLDHDLAKVVSMSGESQQEQYEVRGGYVVGTLPGAGGAPITLSANHTTAPASGARQSAIEKVVESLRGSAINEVPVIAPPPSAVQGPQKRRRLNTAGASAASIAVSSSRAHTPQGRSRLVQQTHASPPRSRRPPSSLGDEDAEGEDDADAEGDAEDESGDPEDKELYCFCQKMSYGEMIACDNDDCPFQWFHLGCVNLKPPLPEHFYCDECLKSLGVGGGGGRKGRRKAQ